MNSHFAFRECLAPACRFRYPAPAEAVEAASLSVNVPCPKCGASTTLAAPVLAAGGRASDAICAPQRPIHLLLDNLRSVFNVGSIFRTADGVGAAHLHLCGITPTPAHPRLAKTALGAEKRMPWSHANNGLERVQTLKEQKIMLIGLEAGLGSRSLFTVEKPATDVPIALVVGNERAGVDPAILAACDLRVSLPMLGQKVSLNVAVACGIALYQLRFGE